MTLQLKSTEAAKHRGLETCEYLAAELCLDFRAALQPTLSEWLRVLCHALFWSRFRRLFLAGGPSGTTGSRLMMRRWTLLPLADGLPGGGLDTGVFSDHVRVNGVD